MWEGIEFYMSKNDNSADFNNWIFNQFTIECESSDFLINHRKYIEKNNLGFGDRAFHYMWYLLMNDLKKKNEQPIRLMEIGVYKGQIISLWALLEKVLDIPTEIHALSPFEGNYVKPKGKILKFCHKINPVIRQKRNKGNLYKKEDYLSIVKRVFKKFDLNFNKIKIHKGYSTTPEIIYKFSDKSFDLIYIDGDHSLKGCKSDIINYSPKIKTGGYLVMDDASCNLPGGDGVFWKGNPSVSKACEIIPKLGFINALNVGHNRIYIKI